MVVATMLNQLFPPSVAGAPKEFAYVLLTLFYAVVVHHIYMSMGVVKARKKYGVPYPILYAEGKSKAASEFNCVQRGHQNSLENLPTFYMLTIVCGLRWPLLTAILGAVYITGRIAYFNGYCSGEPAGRYRGSFMYLGFLPMLMALPVWAFQLLAP